MSKTSSESGSFPRYLVVGVFTSALDFGLFTLLAVGVGIPPVAANIVSTAVTICVSYLINQRWVFRSKKATWGSFVSFASVSLITGMIVQSGVIWAITHAAPTLMPSWNADLVKPGAKIVAMGIGALCNYLGYRTVFHRSDERAIVSEG